MRVTSIPMFYLLVSIVLIAQGCKTSKPLNLSTKTAIVTVDALMHWRNLDYKTIRKTVLRHNQLEIYRYLILKTGREGIAIAMQSSDLGLFFLDKKMFFLIQEQAETHMNPSEIHLDSLQKRFGPPEAYKPSRVAWQCTEWVYPSLGLTIVIREGRTLAYQIRVYQPTTLADYERYIWEDPGSLLDHMQH